MKLLDLELGRESPSAPPLNNNWVKEEKFNHHNQNDPHGIGDLSKGTTLAKFVMTMKTFHFMDNTTMHGIRYVFMRNISQARRLLWLAIVLAGMGYWYYIFTQTLQSYLAYPTVTKIRTSYEKKSEFPAVTLCNYNSVMRSKLTQEEMEILAYVYALNPLPTNVTLSDYDYVDVKEFFRAKGTDYRLDFCLHKSLPCDRSLFSYHVTDYGLCMTFDPRSDDNAKYQTVRGVPGGFYFGSLFPHREWSYGPFYNEEGLRIKVHQSGTVPHTLIHDGLTLVPSLTTEVEISKRETTLLPPPYGECGSRALDYFPIYTREHCLLECETKHTEKICGCKLFFMSGTSKSCTWNEMKNCRFVLQFPPNETYLYDASVCDCPQDCHSIQYGLHLAQVKLSENYTKIAEQLYNFSIGEGIALRLFYKDLQFTTEVEEPVYTVEKLLCDVGGAAGLFLGCSFITVMELLDFMANFFWFCCTKGALLRRKKKIDEKIPFN